jgi:hypothetical protein
MAGGYKSGVAFFALMLTVFGGTPAFARDYYYFNKANVTRDQFATERRECLELAGGVELPATTVYVPQSQTLTATQNAAASGIASLFISMMRHGEVRKLGLEVERTCMADKGYKRYKVGKKLISEINDIKAFDARIDRLFALAGTPDPVGERIKE